VIMKKWDVCMVGGGLAGLASAVYLARAGMEVLLLEKSDRLGGRASTEERAECLFNLGPHALYRKGAASRILNELGALPKGGTPNLNGVLIHEGNVYDLPLTPYSLMKTSVLTWSEKKEWVRLLIRLTKLDVRPLYEISLQRWADEQIAEGRVKQLFYTLCRLTSYTDEPDRVSAGAVIRQIRLSAGGITYLHGGWQSMVENLRARALQAGVTIQCNQRVAEIAGITPEMELRLTDGRTVRTRHVLSTAGPAATYKMVKNAENTRLAVWKDTLVPVKGACLDVALKKMPNPALSFALHMEQPLYFSNHSRTARLSRNPEHSVLHVFKYHRSQDTYDPNVDLQELESFLERLQPGWKQERIASRFLPAMTVAHGLAAAERGPELLRETPVIEELPGLYVAGDWLTGEGLLADASLSSARAAAMQIIHAESKRGASV
jgi:phytoene dehydrogenase-like protein